GKLRRLGFVRQEEVALADFLANRFGRVYDAEPARLAKAG
ncbi:MAG TPA: saccharopine dehydrogenase family protein, partial [Nordella sp.]|nr:saccharopine dehydrogenase family protein [Nordella sp.]